MKLLSVNVGAPREVHWKGKQYTTGIFKSPVEGRIALRTLNLDGDKQVDLSVHGGPDRAVYVYPAEHYDFWKVGLNRSILPWGSFGENLTTEGLLEDSVHIGDRIRFGSAVLTATQPRMPCVKLGIRFDDAAMVKRFFDTDRSGFYMAVVQEGEVAAGDEIEILSRDSHQMTVVELRRIYMAIVGFSHIQRWDNSIHRPRATLFAEGSRKKVAHFLSDAFQRSTMKQGPQPTGLTFCDCRTHDKPPVKVIV
jgi:MOSC domain-containing protein YiiM